MAALAHPFPFAFSSYFPSLRAPAPGVIVGAPAVVMVVTVVMVMVVVMVLVIVAVFSLQMANTASEESPCYCLFFFSCRWWWWWW